MTKNTQWRPTISPSHCKARAKIIRAIREFFYQRDVTEVETPVLSHYGVTDPHIVNMTCEYPNPQKTLYLQTSPEYPMKRLLAAGSGSIYQICKAFRDEPIGPIHSMEFTMLEWYEQGLDLNGLIQQTFDLLKYTHSHFDLHGKKIDFPRNFEKFTVKEAFSEFAHIDLIDKDEDLALKGKKVGVLSVGKDDDFETSFFKILLEKVEPHLSKIPIVALYDFPPSQAALAKTENQVAKRFEFYAWGVEICNGFDELVDARENKKRLIESQRLRKKTE